MKRILVIEDCKVFKHILKYELNRYPILVDHHCSVEEVDMGTCPTVKYDIILSDYNLPGTSGYAFLQHLKDKGVKKVPMALMTANKDVLKECPRIHELVVSLIDKAEIHQGIKALFQHHLDLEN